MIHPNAVGQKAIYDWIVDHMDGDLLYSNTSNKWVVRPSADASMIVAPGPEEYMKDIAIDLSNKKVYVYGDGYISVGHRMEDIAKDTINKTIDMSIESAVNVKNGAIVTGNVLKKNIEMQIKIQKEIQKYLKTPPSVIVYSQPKSLGNMTLNEEGVYALNTILPSDIAVGPHTLQIIDQLDDGNELIITKTIFVEGGLNDVDGDGILDVADNCTFNLDCIEHMGVYSNIGMATNQLKQIHNPISMTTSYDRMKKVSSYAYPIRGINLTGDVMNTVISDGEQKSMFLFNHGNAKLNDVTAKISNNPTSLDSGHNTYISFYL